MLRENGMSKRQETTPKAAPSRNRSIGARRAARREAAERERRIIAFLNCGVSVAEIATREGLTHRRMRAVVQEILTRRMPQPPAEFVAMQISRLSEALLVSYSAMSAQNLEAVDRVVKIVRELDRYHGFAANGPVAADPGRLAPPAAKLLALAAPKRELLDEPATSADPAAIGAASH
jgi:hypothetical protein